MIYYLVIISDWEAFNGSFLISSSCIKSETLLAITKPSSRISANQLGHLMGIWSRWLLRALTSCLASQEKIKHKSGWHDVGHINCEALIDDLLWDIFLLGENATSLKGQGPRHNQILGAEFRALHQLHSSWPDLQLLSEQNK